MTVTEPNLSGSFGFSENEVRLKTSLEFDFVFNCMKLVDVSYDI
jgi:hypothetical protein